MLATTPATGHQRRLERSLRRRRRRKNAHWSDRVATTAVTMQRRLSASWAEAPPRSPQGSLNAPSGVGQFAPVRLEREDARTGGGLVARQQPGSPRQRVRAGGGDQPLRHPVVDVAEAVEARSLEDDAVVQGAAIELHVGEVLEQDVARLDGGTLELLAS